MPTAKSSARTNVDSMDVSRPGSVRTATEAGKEEGNGRTKRRRVGPVLPERIDEEQDLDGCEIVEASMPKERKKNVKRPAARKRDQFYRDAKRAVVKERDPPGKPRYNGRGNKILYQCWTCPIGDADGRRVTLGGQ